MAVKQILRKLLWLRCQRNREAVYYLPYGACPGDQAWQLRLAMPNYDA